MSKLELINITKRYGSAAVVRGISAKIEQGQTLVLLGPSGCGKTTTLRMVAGLVQPDNGSILIDGKAVAQGGHGLPPERRNLAMVFQSYALWPHKTVFKNVSYGLELRGVLRKAIQERVNRVLGLVRLSELSGRYPSELSGGQQQRVALARAVVVEPSLLLLDEPLSNLDASLREQMRVELKVLQQQLGLTSVYVTHDQAEAMVLADHLVLMKDGLIEQEGGPEDVYSRPRTRFVASFLGVTNLVDGTLTRIDGDVAQLDIPGLGDLRARIGLNVRGSIKTGDQAAISIRPMAVRLSSERPVDGAINTAEGTITGKVFLGELTEYVVQLKNQAWRVQAHASEQFNPGDCIWASFSPPAATTVLP
jgi:ABC-type Fe3+/spermidine/putrescine transport system ATPase subunit